MENIAQTLAGLAIADAAFEERVGRKAAFWTATVTANLPDIDVVSYLAGSQDHYFLWSRGSTHSLLALALIPPLVALVVAQISKRSFRSLWALSVLVYAFHIVSEITTSWGVMPFMPFDDTRLALHWVYMWDLFWWVILSIPFWLPHVVDITRRLASRYALGLLVGYVALCAGLHAAAVSQMTEAAHAAGAVDPEVQAYPAPFLPVYWNGVATDRHLHYQAPIQAVGGDQASVSHIYARNLEHPAVIAALQSETGRRFVNWWADKPYAEVRCVGHQRWVLFSDLKYRSPWLDEGGFSLIFELDRDKKTGGFTQKKIVWQTAWTDDPVPEGPCPLAPSRKRL